MSLFKPFRHALAKEKMAIANNVLRAFAFGRTKGRKSRQTETDDQGKRKYEKLKG
jgi:hypothetical protein